MVRAPRCGPACMGRVASPTVSTSRTTRIGRNTSRICVPDSRTTRAESQRPLVGGDGLARVTTVGRRVAGIGMRGLQEGVSRDKTFTPGIAGQDTLRLPLRQSHRAFPRNG